MIILTLLWLVLGVGTLLIVTHAEDEQLPWWYQGLLVLSWPIVLAEHLGWLDGYYNDGEG
jgi:hypothetical protein